jgi:hypothetical protein
MYINGSVVTPSSSNAATSMTPSNKIAVASASSGNQLYLPGNISIARLYDRALSAAEIAQNFNALRGRYGI